MSSPVATASIVVGVRFSSIGRKYGCSRTFTQYDPNTGKPHVVAGNQQAVEINGERIPDDYDPKRNNWVSSSYMGKPDFSKGTSAESNLYDYLIKKDKRWEDEKAMYGFDLMGVIAQRVYCDGYNEEEPYVEFDQRAVLEAEQMFEDMMKTLGIIISPKVFVVANVSG
jgi:hypothetical protein